MPEEEGQAEVTTDVTTPAPLADAEGNLRDGWTETLDESIRGEKCLASVKTVGGAIKSLVNAQRMVGRDKIVRPNEASSEDEWNEYYNAGGRPENALEYGWAKPEDLPDEHWKEDEMKEIMEHYHKIGLSKKQAQEIFDYNMGKTVAMVKDKATQDELAVNKLKDGLAADWGQAYEQKKHLGNVALEKASDGNPEMKERLVEKYGNDPDLIRAFSNIGSQFAEHGVVESTNIPTPSDIQSQIDGLMKKPVYGTEYAKHGFSKREHDEALRQVNQLFEQKGKFTPGQA